MALSQQLSIQKGITAVIGSGGKTTLLRVLGQELSQHNRVLLCTTTKFLPFQNTPQLHTLTDEGSLFWAGTPVPDTPKYTTPPWDFKTLLHYFDYILVEADGSAGLPFKAHLSHEPAIPPQANQTLCIVGLTGFGLPISQVVHRKERFCQLCGVADSELVSPQLVAKALQGENLYTKVIANQADTPHLQALGQQLSSLLPCQTHILSLKEVLL
ncbi:selenium cofactor biosynthesis protein YqeC [Bengtsoniella intestinalis]|uniref:selenium cofactor biosynthesis protein YqeC n=1 Tax=Bengtsoniella intestinalis TaxID=3073143 RepID=UPI00391F4902